MVKSAILRVESAQFALAANSHAGRKERRRQLGTLLPEIEEADAQKVCLRLLPDNKIFEAEQSHSFEVAVCNRQSDVSVCVQTCWEEGEPKNWASDALASLKHVAPVTRHAYSVVLVLGSRSAAS